MRNEKIMLAISTLVHDFVLRRICNMRNCERFQAEECDKISQGCQKDDILSASLFFHFDFIRAILRRQLEPRSFEMALPRSIIDSI